jgi:hypothetical protein
MALPELFADLVADDAADGCTANRADRTTASEYRTAHGTNTGTDRRILVLGRHSRTRPQPKQRCGSQCDGCYSHIRFHGASFKK